MKRLLVILIAAGLILAACGAPDPSRGGGSFDGSDATPVVAAPTSTSLSTDTPPPSATSVPACALELLNLGDPAAWVEGATATVTVTITDTDPPTLLPAVLSSDNGLTVTIDKTGPQQAEYRDLSLLPSPQRVLTLTLANGAVCSATATILAATPTPLDTPTSVPTDTPVPSPTPLPTETPTPTPTLAPIGSTAVPTPTITATIASLPVTGGGEEENLPPESPLDQIWKLIQSFFGGG